MYSMYACICIRCGLSTDGLALLVWVGVYVSVCLSVSLSVGHVRELCKHRLVGCV